MFSFLGNMGTGQLITFLVIPAIFVAGVIMNRGSKGGSSHSSSNNSTSENK